MTRGDWALCKSSAQRRNQRKTNNGGDGNNNAYNNADYAESDDSSEATPLQVTPRTALLKMIAPTILPATGVATSRFSQDAQLATSSLANIETNANAKQNLNGNVPRNARRKHNNIHNATSSIPSDWS